MCIRCSCPPGRFASFDDPNHRFNILVSLSNEEYSAIEKAQDAARDEANEKFWQKNFRMKPKQLERELWSICEEEQKNTQQQSVDTIQIKHTQDDDFFIPIDVSLEEAHENKETFFTRLEPFYAPSVMLDIKLAYILAKHGHRAQFRKELDEMGARVRYFEHVRRVALILFDEARCTRSEMLIAALLHDGIEDTRDLTDLMIEHCFGPDVVSIVKILSKKPKEGYLDRFAMCKDWRPYVIKACDRLDNLRSLSGDTISVDFRERQVRETEEKYIPLFTTMVDLTPQRCKQHAEFLLFQILEQLKVLKNA